MTRPLAGRPVMRQPWEAIAWSMAPGGAPPAETALSGAARGDAALGVTPADGAALAPVPLATVPLATVPLATPHPVTRTRGRPSMTGEADWASACREMILLLQVGLEHVPAVIPIGERDHVWQIIDSSLSRNAPAADGPIAADQAGGPTATAADQAPRQARGHGPWPRQSPTARGSAATIAKQTWLRSSSPSTAISTLTQNHRSWCGPSTAPSSPV